MARRQIIHIHREKCNGCGLCVTSCVEGALAIVEGKAVLRDEASCDGLGACIGDCPRGALTVETREAPEFTAPPGMHAPRTECSCPAASGFSGTHPCGGRLQQWPIQLHLVSPDAPCFAGRELLIASSCAPAACPDLYDQELRGRGLVIACPKLDRTEGYVEKLAAIMSRARVGRAVVLRMEVPCCAGLTRMSQMAAAMSTAPVEVAEVVGGVPRRNG